MELALTQAPQRASLDPAPRQPHDSGRDAARASTGTVTFLFTDVEGSTKLLHELGAEAYAEALAEHRRVIREACAAEGGVEVDTQGDAFFFAFPTAPGALDAASAFTEVLAAGPISVRVGLHTGTSAPCRRGLRRRRRPLRRSRRLFGPRRPGRSLRGNGRGSSMSSSWTLGEHRLKDIAGCGLDLPARRAGASPAQDDLEHEPAASGELVRGQGARARARCTSRLARGARLVTLTGPGRHRARPVSPWKRPLTLVPEYKAGVFWVGLASLRDPALVTRDDRADPRRKGRSRRPHRRARAAPAPRQPGAGDRRGARARGASRGLPQPHAPRHDPRAPAHPGRGRVRRPAARRARGRRALLRALHSSSRPTRSPSCARASTRCRSRSSSRLRARRRSRRLRSSSASPQRLDLLKGGRDADPRQQTLRATIEWSYELLSDEEQQLFARLSVFAGGCTLEAAEEVCDADLDTLQSLVEKSLLRFNERALLDGSDELQREALRRLLARLGMTWR